MSKDLNQALHDMMENQAANQQATPATPRGTAAKVRSAAPLPGGGGGGIASPLVETNIAARVYWDSHTMRSTDGIFWARVRPVRTIVMVDGGGNGVTFEYAQP